MNWTEELERVFIRLTEGFGASTSRQEDGSLVAKNGSSKSVRLELHSSAQGVKLLLRCGDLSSPFRDLVSDDATLLKAKQFIEGNALRPLTSDFSHQRFSPVSRPASRERNIELVGGGVRIRFLEPTFTFAFVAHPKTGAPQPLFAFLTPGGLKNALLSPGEGGTYAPVHVPNAAPAGSLLQITPGPQTNNFKLVDRDLEASMLLPWDAHVESTPAGCEWPFELHIGRLRDEGYLYMRGPFQDAASARTYLEGRGASGTVVNRGGEPGSEWLEVESIEDGLTFREVNVLKAVDRHHILLVSRALASRFGRARDAAFVVAAKVAAP